MIGIGVVLAGLGVAGFVAGFGFLWLSSVMPAKDGILALKVGIITAVASCASLLGGAFLISCGVPQ